MDRMPILNPQSDVTVDIFDLFRFSTAVMAVIIVPIIIGTIWIIYRYRASHNPPDYDPDFEHSNVISKVTLYVPLLTIAVLGALTWTFTHRLDPYRPRQDPQGLPPYEIQAVSLDYKWLFIYPDTGVGLVSELVIPADRAVTIRITSDPMMTSLFIPSLVSQIYAMTGMETRANFVADHTGIVEGSNAMYSGPQFFRQRFKTHIVSAKDFAAFLEEARLGKLTVDPQAKEEPVLDFARYRKLAERTPGYPVTVFRTVEPRLFEKIAQQYEPDYHMNPLPAATPAASVAAVCKGS